MNSKNERLCEFLKKHNLKQKDLAQLLGVHPKYISLVVCGYRGLSKQMAKKISEIYPDTRVDYLLGFDIGKKTGASRQYCDRIKMVRAMEYIARHISNESILVNEWFSDGVADGDIKYGDLYVVVPLEDDVAWDYIDDECFAELMGSFLRCMVHAKESGGLYCGGVESE